MITNPRVRANIHMILGLAGPILAVESWADGSYGMALLLAVCSIGNLWGAFHISVKLAAEE